MAPSILQNVIKVFAIIVFLFEYANIATIAQKTLMDRLFFKMSIRIPFWVADTEIMYATNFQIRHPWKSHLNQWNPNN